MLSKQLPAEKMNAMCAPGTGTSKTVSNNNDSTHRSGSHNINDAGLMVFEVYTISRRVSPIQYIWAFFLIDELERLPH